MINGERLFSRMKVSSSFVIRAATWLMIATIPTACAYCVPDAIHPAAISHNGFCAQYINEDKLVEAEARCKLALEYSTKYAEPYNLLGLIAEARGQTDRAFDYFK